MRFDADDLVLTGFVITLCGLGMFVLASLFTHIWLAVLVSGVVVFVYGVVQHFKTTEEVQP